MEVSFLDKFGQMMLLFLISLTKILKIGGANG